MFRIRLSAVVLISATAAMAAAVAFVYPLAESSWSELQVKRDFVVASDADQGMIVRSLLVNELSKPPSCSPSGDCAKEIIHFDQLSASLRSVDYAGPWAKYEVAIVRPQ